MGLNPIADLPPRYITLPRILKLRSKRTIRSPPPRAAGKPHRFITPAYLPSRTPPQRHGDAAVGNTSRLLANP